MATVDILMATYNGEAFVREQIESIQAQTFKDWRLLVSDDCSADATLDIVHDMASTDPRIEIVSEGVRHGSAKANFMHLLKISDAPYVMFCDQDDVWLSEKISETLRAMRELEGLGSGYPLLVFTDMKVVDTDLNVISESFERYSNINPKRTIFSQLLAQSVGAGCTMMINETARTSALNLDILDDVIMHDWWLSLVCSAFGKIGYVDSSTSLYRQHNENEIGAKRYSPFGRAGKLEEMRESVILTVKQARAFYYAYRKKLDSSQLSSVRHYIAYGNSWGLSSIYHLVLSNCWKKGFRKIGQLVIAIGRK